jgi:hypothetical protein
VDQRGTPPSLSGLALALVFVTGLARAVPLVEASQANPELAERAFVEGKRLMKERRFQQGCAKLAESQRLEPAPGTLLALAYCREQAGLLVSARETYVAAARLAEENAQAERVEAATARAHALESRISTLTFIIPEGLSKVEGFQLKLNSTSVDRSTWGAALPLERGVYVLEVTAPGRTPWRASITLKDEGERQIVAIPMLERVARLPGPTRPPAAIAAVRPMPERLASGRPRARGLYVLSAASAAAGAVSLGIGAAFGLRAAAKSDASNAGGHCDGRGCDSTGLALRSEALSAARVSTTLFVAAGAFAAGSLTLYLVANAAHVNELRTASVSLAVTPSSLSLSLARPF